MSGSKQVTQVTSIFPPRLTFQWIKLFLLFGLTGPSQLCPKFHDSRFQEEDKVQRGTLTLGTLKNHYWFHNKGTTEKNDSRILCLYHVLE